MNEIEELEQNIYDTIFKIEKTLSNFNSKNGYAKISVDQDEQEIKQLEKENLILKDKLSHLKKEHQKDLDNLNNIINELNSVLGDENV